MVRNFFVLICVYGLIGCAMVVPMAHVGAPIRLALSDQASVNEETLTQCFKKYSPAGLHDLRVIQRSDDEYIIQLRGRDLEISHRGAGVWEELAFSVLALPIRHRSVLMLAGMRGKSTLSGSDTLPPAGDRWKPFNDPQQALALSTVEIIFVQVGRCLEVQRVIA